MARLGEICKINMGQSPDSSTYNENGDGIPFFQGNADFGLVHPKVRVWCNAPAKVAYPGDILISVRAPIGAMNIADTKCCIGRGLAVLTPDENACYRKYLWYAIASKVSELNQKGIGSTFKAISKNTLAETEIILPSLEKQKEIAAYFDELSNITFQKQQQLLKLDKLVKSRFSEMFEYVKSEDALKNLCTFIDYRGKTPEKTETGLPFITAKNVKMHHMSFDTQEFISKETYDKVMTRGFPKEGDVVFTTEAPLGNVCRIPHIETEFYIGQRIITMQTESLDSAYLEYALSSDVFRRKIAEKSSGSTVTGIRSKLLEKLTIPVPPIEFQKQFSTFVQQTDKSKLAIQQSLEKLETLKKSLMQQYFG